MHILESLKSKVEKIEVGEYTLYLKRPNARLNMQLYEQQKALPDNTPNVETVLNIITYMLVDENGKLLLNPGSPEAMEVVNDFPPHVFAELTTKCTAMTIRPHFDETKKN